MRSKVNTWPLILSANLTTTMQFSHIPMKYLSVSSLPATSELE